MICRLGILDGEFASKDRNGLTMFHLNEKKLCGILTEAETNFETGEIQKIIVGIGINCFEDAAMPPETSEVATFLDKPREAGS